MTLPTFPSTKIAACLATTAGRYQRFAERELYRRGGDIGVRSLDWCLLLEEADEVFVILNLIQNNFRPRTNLSISLTNVDWLPQWVPISISVANSWPVFHAQSRSLHHSFLRTKLVLTRCVFFCELWPRAISILPESSVQVGGNTCVDRLISIRDDVHVVSEWLHWQ